MLFIIFAKKNFGLKGGTCSICSDYIIFHSIADYQDYQNKSKVYRIKRKLNELSIIKNSNSNLLTLDKQSFKNEYIVKKEKIFYDIFSELEHS